MKSVRLFGATAVAVALGIGAAACSTQSDAVPAGPRAQELGIEGYLVEEIDGGLEVVLLDARDEEIGHIVNVGGSADETFRVEVDDHSVELVTADDGSLRIQESGLDVAPNRLELTEEGLELAQMMFAAQADLGFGAASLRVVGDEAVPYNSEKICAKHKITIGCAFGVCLEVEFEVCYQSGT